MKSLVLLLAFATCAFAGYEPLGLRVKYGSGSGADKDYFYNIPRTETEIKKLGWRETEKPPGLRPHLKLYCPPGRVVCALFHPRTNFVSGIQIGIPAEQFQSAVVRPEKNFVKWHAPAFGDEPAKDIWTITQYFVSEEGAPKEEYGKTIQEDGVWVVGPDGKPLRIPGNENELKSTNFKKQNCAPNMGTHYFYNMSPQMKCEDLFPFFPLVKESKLIGVGFMMYGRVTKPRHQLVSTRDWLETYTDPKISFSGIMPDAPQCLSDNMEKSGSIWLHVYYIPKPWEITCLPEDSQRP